MDTPDPLAPLRSFRDALYACFDRRADALFELADALLVTALTPSLGCTKATIPSSFRRWSRAVRAHERWPFRSPGQEGGEVDRCRFGSKLVDRSDRGVSITRLLGVIC